MAIAVIDIGKTNAKVALVDLARLGETDVRKTPNDVVYDGLYPHYDVERLWTFILDSLRDLGRTAESMKNYPSPIKPVMQAITSCRV